jgi:hypothetical protein
VTAVIAHTIQPGKAENYEAWLQGIIPVARSFPGHLGVQILRPAAAGESKYVVVLQFDGHENLRNWLESADRRQWIERVQPLIQKPEELQVLTGWETWLQLPGEPLRPPPPRYKIALISWMGVYILSLFFGLVLGPGLSALPLLLRQLITTGLVVGILAFGVMPYLTKLFAFWLYPVRKGSSRVIKS